MYKCIKSIRAWAPKTESWTTASPSAPEQPHLPDVSAAAPHIYIYIRHTVQSRSHRISRLIDEHAGIVVEAHKRAVGTSVLLLCANNHSVRDVTTAHLCSSSGIARELVSKVALLLHNDYDAVSWGGCEGEHRERVDECSDEPTLAARFILRTLTHSTRAAPELSMQLSMDWTRVSCGTRVGGWGGRVP